MKGCFLRAAGTEVGEIPEGTRLFTPESDEFIKLGGEI
jgi:hypothetical protein